MVQIRKRTEDECTENCEKVIIDLFGNNGVSITAEINDGVESQPKSDNGNRTN